MVETSAQTNFVGFGLHKVTLRFYMTRNVKWLRGKIPPLIKHDPPGTANYCESEESRRVGLDEDESGQGPNSKRQRPVDKVVVSMDKIHL